MRALRSRVMQFVLATAFAVSCGGEEGAEGLGVGVVREIDAANARVTLEHGDIPGLMKAMTMTFDVADAKLLEDVQVGDTVDFRVRHADGKYTVTDVATR